MMDRKLTDEELEELGRLFPPERDFALGRVHAMERAGITYVRGPEIARLRADLPHVSPDQAAYAYDWACERLGRRGSRPRGGAWEPATDPPYVEILALVKDVPAAFWETLVPRPSGKEHRERPASASASEGASPGEATGQVPAAMEERPKRSLDAVCRGVKHRNLLEAVAQGLRDEDGDADMALHTRRQDIAPRLHVGERTLERVRADLGYSSWSEVKAAARELLLARSEEGPGAT